MKLRLILLSSLVVFSLQLLLEYAKTTRVATLYICVLLLVAATTLANTQFVAAQAGKNQLTTPRPPSGLTLQLPETITPLNKQRATQLQAVISSQQLTHPGNFALYANQYYLASSLGDVTNSLTAQAAILQSHPLSMCTFDTTNTVLNVGCQP